MIDTLAGERRSALMKKIRRADTTPEMIVRRLLHRLGLRFRLQRRDLPGTPDIVLPRFSTVIFVHGCFWHRHDRCPKSTTPSTRREFWEKKFFANVTRDQVKQAELLALGWRVIIVWECETHDTVALSRRLGPEFGVSSEKFTQCYCELSKKPLTATRKRGQSDSSQ